MSCTQVYVQVAHRVVIINFAGPYVTSVGGTTGFPEVASIISGGGFSNYFDVDKYQDYFTDAYVKSLGNKYKNRYTCVLLASVARHSPFLLCNLGKTWGPWNPRHLRTIREIHLHLRSERETYVQHDLLDKRAYYPRSPL